MRFLERHAAISTHEARSLLLRYAFVFVPLFLFIWLGSEWLMRHSPTRLEIPVEVGASLNAGGPQIVTPAGALGWEIKSE